MSVYLVVLHKPDENAWGRLKSAWPDNHYTLTDRIAFVAPDEITLTEKIGDLVGMDENHKVTGFVAEIQYDAINGWNKQALWEWLRKHQ